MLFNSSKQSGAIAFLKEEEIVKPTARFNAFSGLEMLPMYGAILIVYDANSTFDPKFDLRKA